MGHCTCFERLYKLNCLEWLVLNTFWYTFNLHWILIQPQRTNFNCNKECPCVTYQYESPIQPILTCHILLSWSMESLIPGNRAIPVIISTKIQPVPLNNNNNNNNIEWFSVECHKIKTNMKKLLWPITTERVLPTNLSDLCFSIIGFIIQHINTLPKTLDVRRSTWHISNDRCKF